MATTTIYQTSQRYKRTGCPQGETQFTDRVSDKQILVDTVSYGPDFPNWRSRISQGLNATTSLDGVRTAFISDDRSQLCLELTSSGCSAAQINRAQGCVIYPALWTTVLPQSASLNELADNKAKRLVVNRIKPVFDSGTFLGELHRTIKLIRNPAQTLRNGIDDYVRSARALRSRTSAKSLSRLWLEYAYGWTPLIADVQDGLKAINKLSEQPKRRFESFRVAAGDSVTSGYTVTQQTGVLNTTYAFRHYDAFQSTYVYRGLYSADPASNRRTAKNLLGFNPIDFVPSAYNLIPYSFLVDYFTNIGDIVDAWSVGRRNIRWVARTHIYDVERRYTEYVFPAPGVTPNSYWTKQILYKVGPYPTMTQRQVSRATYTNNFIPTFSWELPGILSRKSLNIAALALSKSL